MTACRRSDAQHSQLVYDLCTSCARAVYGLCGPKTQHLLDKSHSVLRGGSVQRAQPLHRERRRAGSNHVTSLCPPLDRKGGTTLFYPKEEP